MSGAKRLLVINTGGTLGMDPRKTAPLGPSALADQVLRFIPEARELADIEMKVLFNQDSANVQPAHWEAIAGCIAEAMDRYDGFVVVHGTDTMAYTAAALSFMLVNLPRPVILTGAQRPIASIRTDAKSNLVNALELATRDIPEVGLFFAHRLLRGNRAHKVSIDDFNAFASPNYPALAEVGLRVEVRDELVRRPTGLFNLQRGFCDKVLIVRLFPGLRPEFLMPLLEADLHAVVIEAHGAGTVPVADRSLIPFIDAATRRGKLVALASQALAGTVEPALYDAGRQALDAGAISCGDMTPAAAAVKMMFLLSQYAEDTGKVARVFGQSIAGESGPPGR
ncbi:MAG: asparaginase [Candidatus Sericytochromatia bacterium]|nr:asparaginase [Candidatus Sericytochromatia bacterium]